MKQACTCIKKGIKKENSCKDLSMDALGFGIWDLNPRPLGHVSSGVSTRPGSNPLMWPTDKIYEMNYETKLQASNSSLTFFVYNSLGIACSCMCVCVYVCVCERERE